MPKKTRMILLSIAVASFVSPVAASVPYSARDLAAQMSSDEKNSNPYPAASGTPLRVAYHDLNHAQSMDNTYGVGAFKRGELRIDRRLNCFMAGTGDLICFTAGLDQKVLPAQTVTQEEKPAPAIQKQ